MIVKGRIISGGRARGPVLVTMDPISFLGSVDPKTGIVVESGHSLEGKSVAGRVLVFPRGKGSTVGSYVILQLKKNGVAPVAIINLDAETIIAVGAIISKIPMLDMLEKDPYEIFKDGMMVEVDAVEGEVRF
ncbi:MAG: DUF126 domain-containing protein [Candidatus ainarchaeum sp.]|nr:DUF126 domain-containing protein [Candidatus ainarchaeum sp.]MDD5096764.1 DUF126 domain-containing protein [Candidatus ainarchaeum sp.]